MLSTSFEFTSTSCWPWKNLGLTILSDKIAPHIGLSQPMPTYPRLMFIWLMLIMEHWDTLLISLLNQPPSDDLKKEFKLFEIYRIFPKFPLLTSTPPRWLKCLRSTVGIPAGAFSSHLHSVVQEEASDLPSSASCSQMSLTLLTEKKLWPYWKVCTICLWMRVPFWLGMQGCFNKTTAKFHQIWFF